MAATFTRRDFLKGSLAAGAGVATAASLGFPSIITAQGKEPVKIGVLHSLSGTMAISEVSLRDVVLMAVEEINAKGGVMGKKLEPVVVDPASNWPLFAEKARQLITQDKTAVVFGCWTSVSRKSVLPVFEELNGLLFYPVQYEGEELSKNVFYTGAAPNQQAIPAVEYLMSKDGGGAKRFFLNYVKALSSTFPTAWAGLKYSIKTGAALRAFIRAAPDVMARARELRRDPFDLNAIREAIRPWGERLRDRRFETEGEWKLKLAGGTRGTVEVLTRELRDALR